MICPNPYCNETEHEPTAKFCHVCGSLLAPKEDCEQMIQKALQSTGRLQNKIDELEGLIKTSHEMECDQKSELNEALDDLARLLKQLDDLKDLC